jgi:hypothetical protein
MLPMDVDDKPWLYEENIDIMAYIDDNGDIGKWMLFCNNSTMNAIWELSKKNYNERKFDGVISMKCSTSYKNFRASNSTQGVIIFYCSNSTDEQHIMNIGKKILDSIKYTEQEIIYYKTDIQTYEGTNATGSIKNYTYNLFNKYYTSKCLIDIKKYFKK